jgi:hypothetical protein
MQIGFAALLYFVIVFAVGFLLGPVRVIWLEPHVGPAIAELLEAPFLVIAMVVAGRWVPKVTRMGLKPRSLAWMGLGALILQQMADLAVGYSLRSMSVSEQWARFATPLGLIYGILLLAFAIMPMLVNVEPVDRSRSGRGS